MTPSASAAPRHAEVAALLTAATAGQHKPVYLFVGETFDTRAAATALLDVLVPAARRAFNLETYDGRTASMATILDSLRTPGFFPGLKAVWVRESPLFLSGEKRGDVTKAMLAAWADGREPDAAEKLLTLVALAGWSQEQFREMRWSAAPKTRVREVFGDDLDDSALADVEAIHAACRARDLGVSAYRDDSGALLDFFAGDIPPHAVLLFTAAAVDARKRVVKRLREIGAVVDLGAQRERSGALTRESVDEIVRHVLAGFGKTLAPAAHDLVLRRAGSETALVAAEMEKLCLYVGDRATIDDADVRLVFRDMAESWIFDFTTALAGRQIARALPFLRDLLAHGEPPLRLLAMIARELRLLLVARECLDGSARGVWRADLPFNAFQSRVLPRLDDDTKKAFGNAHPFVVYKRMQDAARASAVGLRAALVRLSELDRRLKSSRSDPALLLEAFVIDWCRAAAAERQARVA